MITQARDELDQGLAERKAAYAKFRQEAPLLLSRGKEGASLLQDRLIGIEGKRAALLLRKAELQAQLTALDADPKDAGHEALLALIATWIGQADGARAGPAVSLQGQLHPLLMEEQKLLETRGPNHPEVIALRKRIEVTRNFLAGPSAAWRPNTTKDDPVSLYRDYCRQQLKHCETEERLLADLSRQEQASVRQLIAAEIEDATRRADIERRQALYDAVVKQLQQVGLAKDGGGCDARIIAPPAAGKKVQPSALQIFPAALLLGALSGLSLAYLAEIRDKRFRTADEVRQALHLPVIGHIPFFKPQALDPRSSTLDPMLSASHRPSSAAAEAYRGVRTALLFRSGAGPKVVQITSPASGDGKSLLAANLAVSVAQSGKRVLLVDADLRKPRLHRLFGVEAGTGLASVLADKASLEKAIVGSGRPVAAALRPTAGESRGVADLAALRGGAALLAGLL
ncbi:MAG TPA: P-loop NTPase [Gemmataceae bacterium]|nr:P-loop NTPase [Gemmataceae bacterium]